MDPFSVRPIEIVRHPEAATNSGSSGIVGIANTPVAPTVSVSTEAEGLAKARAVIQNQSPPDPIKAFRETTGGDPLQK